MPLSVSVCVSVSVPKEGVFMVTKSILVVAEFPMNSVRYSEERDV